MSINFFLENPGWFFPHHPNKLPAAQFGTPDSGEGKQKPTVATPHEPS